MNNIDKRLEELERIASEHFDYWTEYKGKKTKVINLDAREAVKDLIHQALAEERERVRGIAKRTIGINTTTRFDEVVYKNGIDVKEYINKYDFLSSLDKPLQVDKEL